MIGPPAPGSLEAILQQWIPFLDVSLYGMAIAMSWLLRFARAYWRWCDEPHTLVMALLLGGGGAWLDLSLDGHPWQKLVLQGIALAVAVLIAERALRALGEKTDGKLGIFPRDNEWVKGDARPGAGGEPPVGAPLGGEYGHH